VHAHPRWRTGAEAAVPASSAAARADEAAARAVMQSQELHGGLELPREQALQQLFEHFDTDHTGALDFTQFSAFFAEVSADISLSQGEWAEICHVLGVDASRGLQRGTALFDQFLEPMDDRAVRSLHSKVVAAAAAPRKSCQVCGEGPTGGAGAAGAVYCSEEQRNRVHAMGCLCRRLESRHSTTTLDGPGQHVGRGLLDLYFNEPDHVRSLVRYATAS
jgi:hypothetical protein